MGWRCDRGDLPQARTADSIRSGRQPPAIAVVTRVALVDMDKDGAGDGGVGAMLRLQARVNNVSMIHGGPLSKARMVALLSV